MVTELIVHFLFNVGRVVIENSLFSACHIAIHGSFSSKWPIMTFIQLIYNVEMGRLVDDDDVPLE